MLRNWREKRPTNIAVYEEHAGKITGWHHCSPWAYSNTGPVLLLVDGHDFGFGYDGRSLMMHRDVPNDRREERVEAGKKLLRLMTLCIPPHQRIEHRLDPPIRVKRSTRR